MTKPAPQILGGRIIVIAVLFVLKAIVGQAQTGVLMQSSFETSNLKAGFQVQEGCCSYSLTQSSVQKRSGSTSMRVELNKTDPEAQYGNKRAELSYNNFSSQSSINSNVRWYKWSNYFPSATCKIDPAEEIFSQWHDKSPSCSTSPPLAFEMKNGRYRVVIRYSLTNYCSSPNFVVQYFDLGPIGYDQWNDWVVYYNPQYNSSGVVKVWLNGKLVVNYSGPCFYNGSWFPYWKLGIYKWLWMGSGSSSTTTQRVYYVDDVMTGDNTASESTFVSGGSTTPPANQAPTANAGADQTITLPTSSVTLNGANSSDPDGSIASYKWSQVSGPNTATFSNASASSTTASGLIQGTYVFRLTVTDNAGATNTNDITITVNSSTSASNVAPTANAGSDISITLPTSSASLKGSGTDSDGSISAFAWSQSSGPNTATFSSKTVATPTVSALVAGTYTFKLTVTDNKGATATDNVNVVVAAAANIAPVANAGSDINLTLPTSSTGLKGSGTDADGSISSYAWSQVSGPNTATFSSKTVSAPSVSGLVAGSYSFKLTVKDNKGATGSDNVTVNVATAPNKAPVANAGAAKTITLPTSSVQLSSSSYDPDGKIVTYAWSQVSGPNTATFNNKASSMPTVSNLVAGSYTFKLTVTDDRGATASATTTVTVNAQAAALKQAPIAKTVGKQSLVGTSVSLNGAGSTDPDGTIVAYKWTQVSGPSAASLTNADQETAQASRLVTGTYVFQLEVTDNDGLTGTATLTLEVSAPLTSSGPTARAGNDQTIFLPTASVNLDGSSSSDANGTISAYAWTKITGPGTPVIATASQSKTLVSGLTEGLYSFQLKVTDNDGLTDLDTVLVNVKPTPANIAPVVITNNDLDITLPEDSAQLDGSASYDKDGKITLFQWRQINGSNSAKMSTPNSAKTMVTHLKPGLYVYQLTVKDDKGALNTKEVKITVRDKNGIASSAALKTYPNPVNTEMTIRLDDANTGTANVKIYTITGIVMKTDVINKTGSSFTKTYDLSNYVSGTYVISIQFENQPAIIRKIQKL